MRVKRADRTLLGQLRTLYNVGTIKDLTDGQLLERFATDADELAELTFSALVERHEKMVWRVCLAILRNEHAAQDAFQATFLVLVRRARSLWVQDSLGPWLHQVACRTALCLRRAIIRRRKHEQRSGERDSRGSIELETSRDAELAATVHEEVNLLPEKYRAPIVLCDLEGRTHQEAARFLGWPIGTVKSRQSHGRGLIRDRLVRRGMGFAVAAGVAESLRLTAVAATPSEVSVSTVSVAMQQTGRLLPGFEVSAKVLTLAQGVLRAMLWIKVRFLTVAIFSVGIASVGAGACVLASQEPQGKDGQPGSNRPTTAAAQTKAPKISDQAAGKPATAAPKEMLRAQQLVARKAKALFEIARQTSELAQIAVEEYEEVTCPRDLATVEGEIKLAESDLSRSEDRAEWAKRMFEKKYVSQAQKVSEELSLRKARFTLEQMQSKKQVLVKYTKDKTIKELKSAVAKARSDELAKKATWELETAKEMKLEREARLKSN